MRRLVSVLIVVLVLGTIGGLVICALPRIRDAAARSQCQNNLRQLGMALHNRLDTCGTFPPAAIPNENLPCGQRLSWLVETLPYLEQIGCTINRKQAWQDEVNLLPKFYGIEDPNPPRPLELKMFRCPADPTASPTDAASLANYVGISGVGPDAAELRLEYPGVGFFGCDRQIKPADVKDGTANTIAVMETNADIGPWTAGGFATVRPFDSATVPYLGAGRPFGSGHRGVTQALFADGSVRRFTDSTRPEMLEALATIAGGENIEPPGDE